MILRLLGLPERHGWEVDELLAREDPVGWFDAPNGRLPPHDDDHDVEAGSAEASA